MTHENTPGTGDWTLIHGGRIVMPKQAIPLLADILIEGDTIREIGSPGMIGPK